MASEAQRLIGISLTKIAQSRSHRGGVSLHKNLLVATVLQKARYIFMEEAYNMVHHYQPPAPIQIRPIPQEDLVGLTAEEAGIEATGCLPNDPPSSSSMVSSTSLITTPSSSAASSSSSLPTSTPSNNSDFQNFFQPTCVKCAENQIKRNQSTPSCTLNNNNNNNSNNNNSSNELTYLDLDNKSSNILREKPSDSPCTSSNNTITTTASGAAATSSPTSSTSTSCLKRRRTVAEWETEEAVNSILPKKIKQDNDDDDSVFFDDATTLSDVISKEIDVVNNSEQQQEHQQQQIIQDPSGGSGTAMEIDRITSLVSIFSFSMGDGNKLNRSTTPDLCSTQAKDVGDTLQQRQFLAMTV